jgi:hypothetical protein
MDVSSNYSNSMHVRLPIAQQVAVLTGACCLYLFVWFMSSLDPDAYMQIDSVDYQFLGEKIFTELSFPSSFRTPVFPVFVGFWKTLVGLNVSQYILVH